MLSIPITDQLLRTYVQKGSNGTSNNCTNHYNNSTVFENHPKCRIWIFQFWHFPPIFDLLKLTCLVTLFDRKLQVFKNSPKWNLLGIFNELLSTQNVNVARFARNVEWDFFCDFQTPWYTSKVYACLIHNLTKKGAGVAQNTWQQKAIGELKIV